jgi:hypothetical protein
VACCPVVRLLNPPCVSHASCLTRRLPCAFCLYLAANNIKQASQGLVLTLVEPDARVKVEVVLRLQDLLAHAHPGEGALLCCTLLA